MISYLFSKLKQKGFRWFLWRLGHEVRNPTTPCLKVTLDKYVYIKKKISKIWIKSKEDDFLYAIYDLDINAITFNVVEFLIDAEYESNKRNKKGFVLVFIPISNNPNLGYDEYDKIYDSTSKYWRFQNIVIPLTFLSEKCKGTYLLPERSDAIEFVKGREIYPDLYDGVNIRPAPPSAFIHKFDRPNMFDGLRAPKQGLRYIQTWLKENRITKPIVTITIRDSQFDKARNSNIEAWSQFANYLLSTDFHPVVIPDTDTAFIKKPQFNGITVFKECAWNIGLRASLCESAFLNFTCPSGAGAVSVFNPRCSYIFMNVLPEGSINTTEEVLRKDGWPFGSSFKFATPKQKLVWKADTFENIVHEFELFLSDHAV